jgi:phosphoglycolate phosphatase
MLKMLAFDFDGTLASTIPMVIKAFRSSVAPYVEHELTTQAIVHTFGLNEIGMVKSVAGPRWREALAAFYEAYTQAHREVTAPYPRMVELLTRLREQGIVLALVTGKAAKSCQISLTMTGLTTFFPIKLYGSEFAPNKAANLRQLLSSRDLSPAAVCYVGDTRSDFEAAAQAGIQCLTAAWDPDQQTDAKADQLVFRSVDQLAAYLQVRITR